MEAFKRLMEAALRGAKRGWNPDDPIGLDPETRVDLYRKGFHEGPFGLFNTSFVEPVISIGDAVLRGSNALMHGGAAVTGQTATELGLGNGRSLERELLAMTQFGLGGVGRLGALSRRAEAAQRLGSRRTARRGVMGTTEPIDRVFPQNWQLERLLEVGGRPVKVGDVSDAQIDEIRSVVPEQAANAFGEARRGVYATEGLVDKLNRTRERHADRLIREMPDQIKNGEVYGNTNPGSTQRPMLVRPTTDTEKPNRLDALVLDAFTEGGQGASKDIFVPTIMTMDRKMLNKAKKSKRKPPASTP